MILFYNKKTGNVFATVDGRVHDEKQMKMIISDGTPKKDIGKFVIGWEETKESKEVEIEKENFVKQKNGLYKKVKTKKKIQRNIRKEHNLDKFKLLQDFESNSTTSPLDCKITNNNVIIKI